MGRKRKGKKKKCSQVDNQEDTYKDAPHSFVFHRGHVGRNVKQLVSDTRILMEPFTAKHLQVRKKNVLKDFVSVAGLLHVSHLIMYTKTDIGIYLRLSRLPRGPTLTFKVHNYCLSKDVISSLRKPNLEQIQYLHHPLLVMNNFSASGNHVKLMATMFQNLFPSINVHKVKLNDVKRCVLVNFNAENNLIDFRHYNIKVVPVGMTRGVKKIMQAKVPNLARYGDISEYMNRAGYSSESEMELDGPMNEVILPQQMKSRGNIKSAKSAIRLTELGPRLTLELVKIEEGICDGQVMYHSFVSKTDAELVALKAVREKKRKLKDARRQQQQANIKKKETDKEKNKERSLEGIRKKNVDDVAEQPPQQLQGADVAEDDDIDYYRQEVGQMPDADIFIPAGNKRRKAPTGQQLVKKRKVEEGDKHAKNRSKDKCDKRTSRDNNSKKTEGKTPIQIMMERKKKKQKVKDKKKNRYKGKKKH